MGSPELELRKSVKTIVVDLLSKADRANNNFSPVSFWVRVYEKNTNREWLPDVDYTELSGSFTIHSLG